MDLKTTQLKDTYGNLLTIGTTAGSPTSGILQNGDGDNVIELAIRVDTTTASTITDDLVSVADEKDMAQNNGGGIKFGGVFTTGGSPNADMAFIKASKSNATSGNYSYDMVLGTRANGQTPLERMRIHDNGDISFRDGSASEAFYWDASEARLGIGTTSPDTILELDGGTSYEHLKISASGNTSRFMKIGMDSATEHTIEASGPQCFLTFKTGATPTEQVRIDSSGRQLLSSSLSYNFIGSNTSDGTDNERLFISGGGDASSGRGAVIGLYGNEYSGNTGILALQAGTASGYIQFMTGSTTTERMRIDSNGNVGIGTTSVSNITNYKFVSTNGATGGGLVCQKGEVDKFAVYSVNDDGYYDATSNHIFRTGGALTGSEAMRITSDGYVGIGTGDADVQSGDLIGVLAFNSKDTSTNSSGAIGSIRSYATTTYNTGGVSGDLRFYTQDNGAPNGSLLSGTERMRILSGGGITFNGDTASANALDDYEEGTFDATIYEVGGSDILVEPDANYVKIGSLVHIQVRALGGTTGTSGVVRMNLPFTQTSKGGANIAAYSAANGNIVSVVCVDGADYLEFVDTIGSIAGSSKSIGSDWGATSRLYFNFTYSTT